MGANGSAAASAATMCCCNEHQAADVTIVMTAARSAYQNAGGACDGELDKSLHDPCIVGSSNRCGEVSGGRVREFRIALDRSAGQALGVHVDPADGESLRVDEVVEGLLEQWNEDRPSQAVQQGDLIIEVNGFRGNVYVMIQECKKEGLLEMTVRRPSVARTGRARVLMLH
mmetsp:Transcript_65747/g.140645  ORF Transcript_65747/g.140645 Transcript_65747/m.140645 type:complete len:171 (+) Transcript_65747:75-587(+)